MPADSDPVVEISRRELTAVLAYLLNHEWVLCRSEQFSAAVTSCERALGLNLSRITNLEAYERDRKERGQ